MTYSHLKYEIGELEKIIKSKESRGESAEYEKRLVKSWKGWLKKYDNSNRR